MRDYKNIKAHQHADDLAVKVYEVTRFFPKEEQYGITSQLRCSAVSIPTNIAEGASRQHKRDYLNFLYISRGSVVEVGYLLSLAKRLSFIAQKDFENIDKLRLETEKTLFGLISSVEKELNGR